MGLSSAWLAGEGSGSRGIARTVDKIFGGSVYAAIVCAAFVVYMLGAVCYRRIALRMDIQI